MSENPTIAFLPASIDDDFFHPFWRAAVNISQEKGFNLLIPCGDIINAPYDYDAQGNVIYNMIDPQEIDGIVYFSTILFHFISADEKASFLKRFSGIPAVSMGMVEEGLCSLDIDNASGIRKMLNHLIRDHGMKRIAYIGGIEHHTESRERFRGYSETLEDAGIPFDPELVVHGDFQSIGSREAIKTLLDQRKMEFDAVLCANDEMAFGAVEELKQRGFRIPEDIAVTGYDNTERSAFHNPPLTTVAVPFKEMTRKAFELVLRMINNKSVPVNPISIPTDILIRESCGCQSKSLEFDHADYLWFSQEKRVIGKLINRIPESHFRNFKETKTLLQFLTGESDRNKVLRYLRKYVREELLRYSDLDSRIRQIQTSLVCGAEDRSEENLCASAFSKLLSIIDTIKKDEWAYRLFHLKYINADFRHFLMNISSVAGKKKLLELIGENIRNHYIENYAIVLYDDIESIERISPVQWRAPEKVRLVLSAIEGAPSHCDENGPILETRKLFSRDSPFFDRTNRRWIIRPLYSRDIHYGLIFFRADLMDENIYNNIHNIICSGFLSVKMLEDRQRQTAFVKNANKKLRELDDLKNGFIQNLTHELRSPLSLILNHAELALNIDNIGDDRILERFRSVKENALRLKASIDKILDLTKIDASGIRIHLSTFSLNDYLRYMVDSYKKVLIDSGITISLEEDASGIPVTTDRSRLEDILDNILFNAVQYVDPYSGRITIRLTTGEDRFRISVEDNGIGLAPDSLELIFKRFGQGEDKRRASMRGLGLGLAYARQLASLLEGALWAESEGEGRGAAFHVELPLCAENGESRVISFSDEFASDAKWRNLRILLNAEISENKKRGKPGRTVFP